MRIREHFYMRSRGCGWNYARGGCCLGFQNGAKSWGRSVATLFAETVVLHFAESFDGAEVRPLDVGVVAVQVPHVVIAVGEEDGQRVIVIGAWGRVALIALLQSLDAEAER